MFKSASLHPLFWLWLPLAYFVSQLALELALPHHEVETFVSEGGLIELLQFAVSFCSFLVAFSVLRILNYKKQTFLFCWAFIAALGSFYIAGEEISWGQWFFYWDTPSFWADINDQNETNLHNTSDWLDQKPRLLLEIGTITGGLLLPYLQSVRKISLPAWLKPISPADTVTITALLFLLVKIADFSADHFDLKVFVRPSEVRELLVYYFIFLYMLWFKKLHPQ